MRMAARSAIMGRRFHSSPCFPNMLLLFAQLLIGLLMLTAGAEGLVRGAASLARRLGLSPLVIGLTIVAFGTSTPELVVSLGAALQGNSGIALGNVVGSNIGNIGLILGGAALIASLRVQAQIVRLDIPIMIGVSVALALMLIDGRVGRIEGLVLVAGLIAYTGFTVVAARRSASPDVADTFDSGVPAQHSVGRDLLFVAGGLALLMGGAQLLVTAAVTIAEDLGVSQTVIGLTIVGVGTSLPELATSFAAALRGEADIAIGNVVGSNIFNILGILGTTALAQPLAAELNLVDIGAMLGLALLTLPLARIGYTLRRREGAALLLLYAGYLAVLLA